MVLLMPARLVNAVLPIPVLADGIDLLGFDCCVASCCSDFCRIEKIGVVCRPSRGPCDAEELCDGGIVIVVASFATSVSHEIAFFR